MQVWTKQEKAELEAQNHYLHLTSNNLQKLYQLVKHYVKNNGNDNYYPIQDAMIDLETNAQAGGFDGYHLIHLSNADKILSNTLHARPLYDVQSSLNEIAKIVQNGELHEVHQRKEIELEYINGQKAVAYIKRKKLQKK